MTDPDAGTDTEGEDGGESGTGDDPVVDPAFEESKQTCIATCGLKCKSESSDKKDACIDLCFNQCAASIALVSCKVLYNKAHFSASYFMESLTNFLSRVFSVRARERASSASLERQVAKSERDRRRY